MLRARAALLLAVATVTAFAPAARAEAPEPLRYDLRVDLPVTAAAGALYLVSGLLKEELARDSCRYCGGNAFDKTARDWFLWKDIDSAAAASDVIAFGLLPAALVAHGYFAARDAGDLSAGWIDLLVVSQAVVIAMDLNQIAKVAVSRERPFVHYGNFDDPNRAPEDDDNWSFYSGHASLAFSLAAAAGTVSTMRGYRSAKWVWGVGMSLALATAYLRVASDRHYLSDVLTGAVVGTAVGAGLPWLLHRPRGDGGVEVYPTVGGVVVLF